MKTIGSILALAALASAFAVPSVHRPLVLDARDDSAVCAGAALVSTSAVLAGNTTVQLATFSCGAPDVAPPPLPTAPAVGFSAKAATSDPVWLEFLEWLLRDVLRWYIPKAPSATTTRTVTSTRTTTRTSTTTTTRVSTTTATRTSTSTTTATRTTTATTTVLQPTTTTETETETETETDVVTSVSTQTQTDTTTATATATVTDTATETEVDTETTTATLTTTATTTVTATPGAGPPPTDVCDEICTNVCALPGALPPITEDCQQLVTAINILNGAVAPEFTVAPGHVQTISFGTCRFFFQNNGPSALSSCWRGLAQTASAAGSACFPPVQPVMSEGLCVARTGLWQIGAAHA